MKKKRKVIYMDDCPPGKVYHMNAEQWFHNGERVLPFERGVVEVRHPSDKPKNRKER